MVRAGVPVIPGTKEPIFTAEAGRKFALRQTVKQKR